MRGEIRAIRHRLHANYSDLSDRAFTAWMVKVARSNFKGRITYGAASGLEQVDWSL